MKNSLKTLTRIQKFEIDEQRKVLNSHLEIEDKILKKLKELALSFEREKAFAHENPGIGDFGTYVKRYLNEREVLEEQLIEIRKKIEEVRDLIADLFKEQKTYEIVDENRRKRAEKEDNDKEQKTIDEIGTNSFIRKKKNEN